MTNEKWQMENGKSRPSLSRLRLQLNEVSGRRRHRTVFYSPQTIRDTGRSFHSSIVITAHLGPSLVDAADVVGRAARCLNLLERVATFGNCEVVLGVPALLYVVDLQPVKLHPMNLVASLVINIATEEGHRHAALAADQT